MFGLSVQCVNEKTFEINFQRTLSTTLSVNHPDEIIEQENPRASSATTFASRPDAPRKITKVSVVNLVLSGQVYSHLDGQCIRTTFFLVPFR